MTPKSRVVDVLAFYGTIINNHKLGSLTEQNWISHSSGGLKSKNQGISRAMLSLHRLWERMLPCFFQLLVVSGIHWLVVAWLQYLLLSSLGHLLFLCVWIWISLYVSIKILVVGFRTHPGAQWLRLYWFYLQKTLFPNKVIFWGSGGHKLWRGTLQPSTGELRKQTNKQKPMFLSVTVFV